MTRSPLQLLAAIVLAAGTLFALSAAPALAQYRQPELNTVPGPAPFEKGEVGVDEKPGAIVPTATPFIDQDGRKVALGDLLGQGRPIVLWLGYYECPMLCDQMSKGMVDAVKGIRLEAGREFSIVNVSVNPDESAGLAKTKRQKYLDELGQPGNASAWNLLVGSPDSIRSITDAVGYKFKKVTVKGEEEYAHPAVLVILSPEGKVTRYLYPLPKAGVQFDADTMRLSLIEASDGKVGTLLDRVILTCLRYDAHAGKYTKDAIAIMRWAGGATILVMAVVFVPLWVRAARARGSQDDGNAPPGQPSMA